jgi:hypothetical protein
MNFKKLFEVCGIIEGAEVSNIDLRYTWFESDVQAETHKRLYTESPELLKALIKSIIIYEDNFNDAEECEHIQEEINLIESVLSSPEKPITWGEIKEILEDE